VSVPTTHSLSGSTPLSMSAPMPPVAPSTMGSAIVGPAPTASMISSAHPQVRAFPTTTASTYVNPGSNTEPHVVAAIPLSQLPMFQSVMQQSGMTHENVAPQMVQVSIASVPTS
jgi:hypothetical protein